MKRLVLDIPSAYRRSSTCNVISKLYNQFTHAGFSFEPSAKITRTDKMPNDVLRKPYGKRHAIFTKMENGMTVDAVCKMAKPYGGTKQHDLFQAVIDGLITLRA